MNDEREREPEPFFLIPILDTCNANLQTLSIIDRQWQRGYNDRSDHASMQTLFQKTQMPELKKLILINHNNIHLSDFTTFFLNHKSSSRESHPEGLVLIDWRDMGVPPE
jgi:hypothetical protein